MLKKLHFKSWLLMLCMLVGVGNAWAADEVYKTALFGSNYNSKGVSGYNNVSFDATYNGFKVNVANFNNNNNGWNFIKCGSKNGAYTGTIITDAAIDNAITKVVVTIDAITSSNVTSITLYTSSDKSTWEEAGSFSKSAGSQTVNLASPTASLYYKIEFVCTQGTSNGLVTVSKVEYYYNQSGTVSPSISADDVSIAYTAISGAIAYTVNNGVTGGTLSTSTTADWLTLGTATSTTVPFTCTTNEGAERSATVTLTYAYGSETVTKDVIVTQAANPNGPGSEANPYTVAQARAAIDDGTGLTDVYATGIISQVDSYNSQYNSITYWISDDGTTTDQLEVYSGKGLNNTNFTSKDDVVVGATVVVYGTLKKFNDTYEFDKNNYLVSYTAPAVAVEAPTFSPAAGTYAEAQNVTISSTTDGATIYYTTDGTDPTTSSSVYSSAIPVSTTTTIKAIAVKGSDESTVATATYHFCSATSPYTVTQALAFNEYPANEIYVTGIVSTAPTQAPTSNGELTYYISVDGEATNQLEVYKGKGLEQAAFTAQDDIQVGDIVTIFGNVVIYGTSNPIKEFATGNYLVAFERPAAPVVPVINANDKTIEYNATSGEIEYTITNPAEGTNLTATTEAEWISNITVGESAVSFTTTANESDADRTATITLAYEGAVDKTVTVTQGHYIVDYATLPFAFDGGQAAIENTNGLTQNGLGSDYNNSPKLKFDSTGDELVLKFNKRPGTLTFDIQGNGFSGGTFKVQTSEDGETYTDLKTYTELASSSSESFDDIDKNVRYIKWVYTEKVSGNVALGNIILDRKILKGDVNEDGEVTIADVTALVNIILGKE